MTVSKSRTVTAHGIFNNIDNEDYPQVNMSLLGVGDSNWDSKYDFENVGKKNAN